MAPYNIQCQCTKQSYTTIQDVFNHRMHTPIHCKESVDLGVSRQKVLNMRGGLQLQNHKNYTCWGIWNTIWCLIVMCELLKACLLSSDVEQKLWEILNPFWMFWLDCSQNRKSEKLWWGEKWLVYSELQSSTNLIKCMLSINLSVTGLQRGPDKRLWHDDLLTINMWYSLAFMSLIFSPVASTINFT